MATKTEKLILLDADIISHFISGGQFGLLPSIFSNKKVILDIVAHELRAAKKFKTYIDNVISTGFIKEIDFKTDREIIIEYSKLSKTFGKGESACMAYCKFNKDVLASSNLKDISRYCKENEITYLTTMDFLAQAYKSTQLSEQECNDFIKQVKSVGSKLPVDSIKDYLNNFEIKSI